MSSGKDPNNGIDKRPVVVVPVTGGEAHLGGGDEEKSFSSAENAILLLDLAGRLDENVCSRIEQHIGALRATVEMRSESIERRFDEFLAGPCRVDALYSHLLPRFPEKGQPAQTAHPMGTHAQPPEPTSAPEVGVSFKSTVPAPHEEHRQRIRMSVPKTRLREGMGRLQALMAAKKWDAGSTRAEAEEEPSTETSFKGLPAWQRAVRSMHFDVAMMLLICANTVVTILELEHSGFKASEQLGVGGRADGQWAQAEVTWTILKDVFCVIFALELSLRLATHGRKFFGELFNVLDFLIVIFTSAERVLELFGEAVFPDVICIRLLRIGRLMKVLRMVRVMRCFVHLRVLVFSIYSSVRILMWSVLLLSFIQAIVSMGLTQALQGFIMDEENDREVRLEVYQFFGCWSHSMLTMFEISLAPGAWATVGRLLIYKVNSMYWFFFFPYVWVVTFAVIRIISAIFLKETLAVAANDQENATAECLESRSRDLKSLRSIFDEADPQGLGYMNLDEFSALIETPQMVAWLRVLEIEPSEMQGLVALLDDGDGYISFDEFLTGVRRWRADSKSLDAMTFLYESKKLADLVQALRRSVDGMAASSASSAHALYEADTTCSTWSHADFPCGTLADQSSTKSSHSDTGPNSLVIV